MIKEERVTYCPETSSLYSKDYFRKMQVNQERGPLIADAIALFKKHFDQMTKSSNLLISFHFTIHLPEIGPILSEPAAERWLSIFLKAIEESAQSAGKTSDLGESLCNSKIRCFWASHCRSSGPNTVKVYMVAGLNTALEDSFCNQLRLGVDSVLREAVKRCTRELYNSDERFPVATIIPGKSALDLISKDAPDYEREKALLFYKLSMQTAKPAGIAQDDLVHVSVLTHASSTLDVMFSSAKSGDKTKDKWQTPPGIFAQLNGLFNFTLDAAAEPETALCKTYFTEEDDALVQDWSGHVVFCNPPYSKLGAFAKKAYEESIRGATVVMLVPARTDTKAFHEYLSKGEVSFIKGRLKFLQNGQEQDAAPFPSMVCVLGGGVDKKMDIVSKDVLKQT
ncbi:DNA N-6-adenine-methyltransferase [Vibrio parahaemolyticus]|nr:DNA N-6-adenine-methyltransferase [Vibrio parahaemolyticus]